MIKETLLNYGIRKSPINTQFEHTDYAYQLPNGDVISMHWNGLDNRYHFSLADNNENTIHRSYVRYKTIKAFEEDLICYTKPFDKDSIGYMLDINY